jgi:hypothetical protein
MLTRINRQQLAEKTLSGRAVVAEALPDWIEAGLPTVSGSVTRRAA